MIIAVCGCDGPQEHMPSGFTKLSLCRFNFRAHTLFNPATVVWEKAERRGRTVSIPHERGFVLEGLPIRRERT